jgi:hypothetical protein
MKFDLDPGEAGPVFYGQGIIAVPNDDETPVGAMIGEVQASDAGYVAFSYRGRRITWLGEHDCFDAAIEAFAEQRMRHRTETARPMPVLIGERIRRQREAAA